MTKKEIVEYVDDILMTNEIFGYDASTCSYVLGRMEVKLEMLLKIIRKDLRELEEEDE